MASLLLRLSGNQPSEAYCLLQGTDTLQFRTLDPCRQQRQVFPPSRWLFLLSLRLARCFFMFFLCYVLENFPGRFRVSGYFCRVLRVVVVHSLISHSMQGAKYRLVFQVLRPFKIRTSFNWPPTMTHKSLFIEKDGMALDYIHFIVTAVATAAITKSSTTRWRDADCFFFLS